MCQLFALRHHRSAKVMVCWVSSCGKLVNVVGCVRGAIHRGVVGEKLMMSSLADSALRQSVQVVSGASRGIGLEFTRQLLSSSASKLIALSRTCPEGGELHELMTAYPERLQWIATDLQDEASIHQSAKIIKDQHSKVDLLINCAGILGDNSSRQPGPERSISAINKDWLTKTFEVNLFGHVMLTQALAPLMKTNATSATGSLPLVVCLSARVGSISDNRLGGWYSYRMSKAALNMFVKTLSLEMKRFGVAVVSVHPGTTDTELSKPFQKNVAAEKLFSTEYSVGMMMRNVLQRVTIADTGKFYAYDGSEIPY